MYRNETTPPTNASSLIRAALIGSGITRSLTPAIHEAEGQAQGIPYRYDLFDVNTGAFRGVALAEIVSMAEAQGYAGLNITHPFKTEIVSLVDDLTDDASTIGAVNTVVFRDGTRTGHNTDYTGFKTAFTKEMPDAKRSEVLLLGAGGAGAAVALALVDSGVERLIVFDKDAYRAAALVARIRTARPETNVGIARDLESVDRVSLDGVVNATPVGMNGYPGAAINAGNLSPETWVAEIIYFPLQTELLVRARNRGCRIMNGTGMAIHQAVAAFEIITGLKPEAKRVSSCFNHLLAARRRDFEEFTNEREHELQ